jgi:uncharacterized protein involved in exopolysaccharide biosynthesis
VTDPIDMSHHGHQPPAGAAVSWLHFGSLFLEQRRIIIALALLGGLAGGLTGLLKQRRWTSSASFLPKSASEENRLSGLQNLAGQFGLSVPGAVSASPLSSPAFLADVVESMRILGPVLDDTLAVVEKGGRRIAMLDLLEIDEHPPAKRRQLGLRVMSQEWVELDVPRSLSGSGALKLSVSTPWPSVSQQIGSRVIAELNRLNLQAGQAQAAEERRFVEQRLEAQRQALVAAEERLAADMRRNRVIEGSPELIFERERLQRDVSLQQQIFLGLAQRNEDTRIREVRDVPVLTVIEPPSLPVLPDARGTVRRGFMGLLIGAAFGALVVLLREIVVVRREAGDPAMERFVRQLGELRPRLKRP